MKPESAIACSPPAIGISYNSVQRTLTLHPSPEHFLKSTTLDLKPDWHFERDGQRQHYTIQAWQQGQMVGRAHGWFEPDSAFVIDKIEIDRRHRSRGYGSEMISALRSKARSVRCTEFVFSRVMPDNVRAIGLYQSLGAKAIETTTHAFDFRLSPP
ncbi:MAG: GNAT family N-acetyltransferase [Arenimonas sp.]|nr:GNAT family N-acetyltransferase [Arenimonas sp.]